MTRTSSGQCLCGRVGFTVGLPVKWVAHCHCTRCQRAHGAAFVTWVGAVAERATIDDPSASLRWHVADEGGQRGFCGTCGSPMFFTSARWPGELHVARALFTEPVGQEPQAHVFYDTHVPWVAFGDALPRKA
jgi:hypothetical protein